jgi:hypothetical protein
MIKFGEWLPDQPDLENKGVTVAENVIPAFEGYRSLSSLGNVSNQATNILKNIFSAKDNSGNVKVFAGDTGKLYEFNAGTSNLDDISKGGGYSLTDSERWRFVQFGTSVIVAGGVAETLQEFTLGTDSAFADLGGTPPKADFIAVVRDQVWTANIDEGSGRVPFRVRWSGINNSTQWTVGTDQADFQDIPDAGAITGLVGGEYATILMEKAIVRASYVGTPLIYQIDKVETARGCTFSGSVSHIGNTVFFLNEDGFYAFDGTKSVPIGAEKVNKFFFKDFNSSQSDKMTSAVDPTNQIVVWSYVSNSNQSGATPDRLLIYNYAIQRWSIANVSVDLIAPFFTAGYTLEALDNLASNLDSLPAPLDSNLYKGGAFLFGGSVDKKITSFTGQPLSATIETSEFALNKGKHSLVTRSVPYFKNGSVTVQVGARDRQDNDVTFSTANSLTDEGFVQHRSQGRFHRIRMNITGFWDFAQGFDIEGQPLGRR